MSNQTSIDIEKPRVEGIDPTAPGLLLIRVPLTPEPDGNWRALFEQSPDSTGWPTSMHFPTFGGLAGVELRTPDDELGRYVEELRKRVAQTNEKYAAEVLPELERQQQAEEAAKDEEEQRLADAQKFLDDLGS